MIDRRSALLEYGLPEELKSGFAKILNDTIKYFKLVFCSVEHKLYCIIEPQTTDTYGFLGMYQPQWTVQKSLHKPVLN